MLPADAILSIANGHLLIQTQNASRRERKPIDVFFSSLAEDQGESSVGVSLSDGDGDGTLGIKAIKEHGGLTFAQPADSFGPAHPDMPDSAISTGLVDVAMPVEQMGAKLAEFARTLPLLDQIAVNPGRDADGRSLDEARTEIYAILRNRIGHDFGGTSPRRSCVAYGGACRFLRSRQPTPTSSTSAGTLRKSLRCFACQWLRRVDSCRIQPDRR